MTGTVICPMDGVAARVEIEGRVRCSRIQEDSAMTSSTLLLVSCLAATPATKFVLLAVAIIPGMSAFVCARAISRWLEHHTER